MTKFSNYRVLISGITSPLAAFLLYVLVYTTLTAISSDREKDWLFRLSLSTLAMTLPFLVTLALAIKDRRRHALSLSAKAGVALAILSLGLVWKPVHDGILRSKQSRNQALRDVAAPPFDTLDVCGKRQRLEDHNGEVVLVSLWATWCGPCRAEMPRLDKLYRGRKDQGFVVFGLSDEDASVQRQYLEQVPVTYPILTVSAGVPRLYREIVRYPAFFLIDRQGRLQPAPGPDQPVEKIEAAVDALLNKSSSPRRQDEIKAGSRCQCRAENMRPSILLALALSLCHPMIAGGARKLLAVDPLTNLPLYPATDSRLHLGNDPTRLPESKVCGSTMQADFYTVYDSKVNATLAWYNTHLPGFKKTHAYAANRSQDTFYNPDETLAVSVTGSSGKADENTDTYSVVYSRFQPALPEKAIIGLNQQKLVCP
jgi:thiol-disulfide isomerase/thioredoxin